MTLCPCGSNRSLEECCGPLLAGAPASTPEALMRSRYSAYALCNIDHLERSLAPESRSDHDRKAAEEWSRSAEWLGLSILSSEGGKAGDETGMVEFLARFRHGGLEQSHHETSRFRRHEGGWVYVDGKVHNKPTVRSSPKVGRNDPCPCGSGRKYKQCCGR